MQQIEWLDKLGLGQSPTLNAPVGAASSFGIFAILLAIYVLSPINTSGDSRWSLHTAMSLVRGHAGDLTEYTPALQRNGFYAIRYVDGRPRTYFPIGVSILAVPAVTIAWLVRPGFSMNCRTTFQINSKKSWPASLGR